MSEDWVQTPAWPLSGYVMLGRLSLSLFICLGGILDMQTEEFMQSVWHLALAYTWGCQLLLLTALRPGRLALPTLLPGLPLGYVPTRSHLGL